MNTKTLIILGAANQQSAANTVAQQMQNAPAFTVPVYRLTDVDDSVAFTFWSAPMLNEAQSAKVQAAFNSGDFPGATINTYDPVANPGFPDQQLAAQGLRRALPKMNVIWE